MELEIAKIGTPGEEASKTRYRCNLGRERVSNNRQNRKYPLQMQAKRELCENSAISKPEHRRSAKKPGSSARSPGAGSPLPGVGNPYDSAKGIRALAP